MPATGLSADLDQDARLVFEGLKSMGMGTPPGFRWIRERRSAPAFQGQRLERETDMAASNRSGDRATTPSDLPSGGGCGTQRTARPARLQPPGGEILGLREASDRRRRGCGTTSGSGLAFGSIAVIGKFQCVAVSAVIRSRFDQQARHAEARTGSRSVDCLADGRKLDVGQSTPTVPQIRSVKLYSSISLVEERNDVLQSSGRGDTAARRCTLTRPVRTSINRRRKTAARLSASGRFDQTADVLPGDQLTNFVFHLFQVIRAAGRHRPLFGHESTRGSRPDGTPPALVVGAASMSHCGFSPCNGRMSLSLQKASPFASVRSARPRARSTSIRYFGSLSRSLRLANSNMARSICRRAVW